MQNNGSGFWRKKRQTDEWTKLCVSKYFVMCSLCKSVLGDGDKFSAYVKNSSNRNFDTLSFCDGIQSYIFQVLYWKITCKNDQVLAGDQVLIQRETPSGRLAVYDIKVFRKYSIHPHTFLQLSGWLMMMRNVLYSWHA